jgi:hypothetical protein
MMQYAIKVAVTAVLVVLISEVSKRSTLLGAVLASVPITSVLAMIWLYSESRDVVRVASLSRSVFWLVIPSLLLFVVLPFLLNRGHGFYPSLLVATIATVVGYLAMIAVAGQVGLRL